MISDSKILKAERDTISRWSACFFQEVQTRTNQCDPYPIEREGFPFAVFGVCVLYAIVFLVFIRRIIGKPLADMALGFALRRAPMQKRGGSLRAEHKRQGKFVGSFVELTFYSLSFFYGARLLHQQLWVFPSRQWYDDTPATHVSIPILIYALFYSARYCATFFSLVFLEHKKKDFMEMVLHHIATVLLLNLAIANGYIRVSLIIMVLFDAADPLLHFAKLLNYMKQASGNTLLATGTDVALGLFALMFTFTRIGVFSYIVYSVTFESYLYTNCPYQECPFWEGVVENADVGQHVCVFLLWVINLLQWFWFWLLVKVIYKSVVKGVSDDGRSETDEDGASSDSTSKKNN